MELSRKAGARNAGKQNVMRGGGSKFVYAKRSLLRCNNVKAMSRMLEHKLLEA
jgi:hypothetical protein